MTDTTHIRRRPDGSIDTAYHMQQGRARPSAAAHEMARAAARPARRPVLGLAALVALVPLLGTHG